jgi:putative transposase
MEFGARPASAHGAVNGIRCTPAAAIVLECREFIRRLRGTFDRQTGVHSMSFWRTFYHLVWTTKNREPLITPEIEPRLYAYLVHKAAELGAFVYVINGCTDHIHIIVAIPPHVSISDLVKHLKGASSHELNQQRLDFRFAWQRGYGVLTLGQRQKPDAELYVKRQKEHHGAGTTLAWLERCSEINEGPEDLPPSTASQPVPAVHELHPVYEVLGEPAF